MKESVENIINETKGKNLFPNFIVIVFISCLLLIDFFSYFKSYEIINPQFLYLSVLNFLIGVYFYANSQFISADIFQIFKRSYIVKLYSAFVFFCALSYFAARNTSLVFTKITEIIIIFCLFINLSILLKNKLDLFYKITFIVCISAFLQAWQQLAHFVVIPKNVQIIDLLNGLKGNTGNINILAASLSIKIPFILVGMIYFKNYKRFFLIFALFSVTTVIFLTGARTALINLTLLSIVYVIFLFRKYHIKKITIIKASYLIVPMLFSVIFSNSIFSKLKNNERYVSLENRIGQINKEESSSRARLIYWNNALKISKEKPFLGVGLGNYRIESIPYEKTTSDDSVVSLHTHNDFLEILAETGFVNALVYFSLFIYLLFINLKSFIKEINKPSVLISLLILMLLIVYGIDSIFNFPMYRPTMAIFFSFLLALSLLNNSVIYQSESYNNSSGIKILVSFIIGISLLTSYSSFIIYKASNLEYLISGDDINVNKRGFLTGDEVIKRMPAYPNVFNTSESFYEYAGIYYVREKKYDKALQYFSKAQKINNYSGRIELYKAIISKDKGNLDSAYVYTKRAFYLRPRNYDFYKSATTLAILKKDTVEILKEHQLFNSYRSMSQTWIDAAQGLRSSGYNYKNLLVFVDTGLKSFPKDSLLKKMKNNLLVTNYLVGGQGYETNSELNKAFESYEKALKIDPKNVYALQNIGFNYFKRGENKKAISSLLNTLQSPGLNDGKTEFYLGICYLKENDKTNALKYIKLSKDKNYPASKQLLSYLNNATLKNQKNILKQRNDLLIADYITQGQKFEAESKLDKALESYEKALRIDSKNIYASQNIGFYFLKTGQIKKAINYLLDALKYPGLNDGKTEFFLGLSYLKENDSTNACKYFAISKNKNYPTADQFLVKNCK